MDRSRAAIILTIVLVGCGSPAGPLVGFVNQTQHSNADLWAIWKRAQDKIAQRVDLNPVQRFLNQAPADIRAGDSRALSVVPRQVQVASEPDVLSTALFAATGNYRADPTGLIACPAPCSLRYAAAYSSYQPRLTKYAASWELQDDNFGIVLEYEFENQILTELGYDMKWR